MALMAVADALAAVVSGVDPLPEEAVSLRRDNLTLPALVWNEEKGDWLEPADNWGELRFSSAAPEAGAEWCRRSRNSPGVLIK